MPNRKHGTALLGILTVLVLTGIHKHNNDSRTSPLLVTLVTYGRSGSTFVGNLLRMDKNVFYAYEPLHFLDKISFNDLHYFDNKTRTFDTEQTAYEVIIRHTLTCHFLDLPLEYWNGYFYSCEIQGNQLCKFLHQYKNERKNRFSSPTKFKNVLVNLQQVCKSSKTVMIKTIRTPLHFMKPLLASLVNLKVIHLVRDPRATIFSQNIQFKRSLSNAETFCQNIFRDIETFSDFNLTYPGKLYRLVLEDFAMNPLTATKSLYAFINLTLSDLEVAAVKNMTLSDVYTVYERKKKSIIPPSKANSWQLANEWRLKWSLEQVIFIDRSCSQVYEKLGYITVSDERLLRNISKSVNNKLI